MEHKLHTSVGLNNRIFINTLAECAQLGCKSVHNTGHVDAFVYYEEVCNMHSKSYRTSIHSSLSISIFCTIVYSHLKGVMKEIRVFFSPNLPELSQSP